MQKLLELLELVKLWAKVSLERYGLMKGYGSGRIKQCMRDMPETIDAEQTCSWLGFPDLKVQTGALICAAQEQALRTNYVKHHVIELLRHCYVKCAVKRRECASSSE